jgi:hypothetical protein
MSEWDDLVAKYQCNPTGELSSFEALRNQLESAHRLCNENYDWAKRLESERDELTAPYEAIRLKVLEECLEIVEGNEDQESIDDIRTEIYALKNPGAAQV